MTIRSDKFGRILNCSLCLNDYVDHIHSEQMCKRCFKDTLNFKDLEDTYTGGEEVSAVAVPQVNNETV
jgi:hypothetical protein